MGVHAIRCKDKEWLGIDNGKNCIRKLASPFATRVGVYYIEDLFLKVTFSLLEDEIYL